MLTNALWKKVALTTTPNELPRVTGSGGFARLPQPRSGTDLAAWHSAGTNRRCRHLTVGDACWGYRMFLVSLIAFIVVIVSHAALYVWALSYRPLTRDFRERVNRQTVLSRRRDVRSA